MGTKHSTLAPTDDDFLVQHTPPPRFLCEPLGQKGCTFTLSKNSWSTETAVDGMELTIAPAENDKCYIVHQGTAVAVMHVKDPVRLWAQVCTIYPSKENQKSCGEEQGKALYQCAMIAKDKSKNEYMLRTTADSAEYKTSSFGRNHGLVLKRDGVVCASFERDGPDWKCRVGPGLDFTMMVCFIVCHDKLVQVKDKNVESAAYLSSMRYQDVVW